MVQSVAAAAAHMLHAKDMHNTVALKTAHMSEMTWNLIINKQQRLHRAI